MSTTLAARIVQEHTDNLCLGAVIAESDDGPSVTAIGLDLLRDDVATWGKLLLELLRDLEVSPKDEQEIWDKFDRPGEDSRLTSILLAMLRARAEAGFAVGFQLGRRLAPR